MVRQITDLNNRQTLEVKARPVDTYVKPAKPVEDNELEAIAVSLQNVNPAIQKYVMKKREERKNFEEAVGAQIWRKLVATGQDKNAPEISEMVQRGEIEGFRKLTMNNWNGIVKARTAALGNSLEGHMQEWAATATGKDENGNDVPLSSLKDQSKVMALYQQEQSRWIEATTGGQYDPMLFEELVQPKADNATNIFIQQHASRLREQLTNEQAKAMTQAFDSIITPHINENGFTGNTEGTVTAVSNGFKQTIDMMRSSGMPEDDINKAVEAYVTARLREYEVDGIDGLVSIMKTIPSIWDNPDIRGRLSLQASEARQARMYNDRLKRQAKQDADEMAIDEEMLALAGTGSFRNIPYAKRTELLNKYKLSAGYIRKLFGDFDEAEQISYDTSVGMSPAEFDSLQLNFLRNGGTLKQLSGLYPKMNMSQRLRLQSIVEDNIRARKVASASSDTGGGNYGKFPQYMVSALEGELNFLMFGEGGPKGSDYTERSNTKAVRDHYLLKAYAEMQEVLSKNPGIGKNRFLIDKVASDVVHKVYTEMDSKNLQEYQKNPNLLKFSPSDLRLQTLSSSVKGRMSAFRPDAKAGLQELQRRMGTAGYQPTKEDLAFIKRSTTNKEWAANPAGFLSLQSKELQELNTFVKGNSK